MNTTPSGMASSWRDASSITPRRVETRIMSPVAIPSRAMVPRETDATGPGSSASSVAGRGAPPRHGARVPVLELAAGGENERIVRVRGLVRRRELGGDQLAEAAR